MDNDYGIFVTSERIRSRLTKARSQFASEITLYEVSENLIETVPNSMQYAVVIGEQVDEFCERLRSKGIMVFRYDQAGEGYGQILLSSFIEDKNVLDVIINVFEEFSLHLTRIYSPIAASICANQNMNESVRILREEYDSLVSKSLMLDMIFNQKQETDILSMVKMARGYYYQLEQKI